MKRTATADGWIYEINSASKPGEVWHPAVCLSSGDVECPCPDFSMRRLPAATKQHMTPNVGTPAFQCRHIKLLVRDMMLNNELSIDAQKYDEQFETQSPINTMESYEPYGSAHLNSDTDLEETEIVPQTTQSNRPVQKPDSPVLPEPEISFPGMVISPKELASRQTQLVQFRDKFMKRGLDYGNIPGCGNKDVLLKPGAEKLCALFGWAIEMSVTNRIERLPELVSYEVMVKLSNKDDGKTVAKGIGLCNSGEKKYKNSPAADMANTCIKMSKKRALVDATLAAVGASGLFASEEDLLEVSDENPALPTPKPRPVPQSAPPQQIQRAPVAQHNPQAAPAQRAQSGYKPSGRPGEYNPEIHGQKPDCPVCGGEMWDNRSKIADGTYGTNRPFFGCKNRECKNEKGYGGALWGPKDDPAGQALASMEIAPTGAPGSKVSALTLYSRAVEAAGLADRPGEGEALCAFFGMKPGTFDPDRMDDESWTQARSGIEDGSLTW